MRCLESGELAPPAGRVTTIDRKHRELRTCGSCGRLTPVTVAREPIGITTRLAIHGNRKPCPVCNSRSPQHHARDHDQETRS